MPSGGHNAKPLRIHEASGSYDHDKGRYANRGPKSGGEPLRKPDDLPEHASWLWDEVTRRRSAWLCGSDAAALEVLCFAFHHLRTCQAELTKEPTDKPTRLAYSTFAAEFKSLGARFGLTPADRARLGEDKPLRDEQSELEDLIG